MKQAQRKPSATGVRNAGNHRFPKPDTRRFVLELAYPSERAIDGLRHDLKRFGRVLGMRALSARELAVNGTDGPLQATDGHIDEGNSR